MKKIAIITKLEVIKCETENVCYLGYPCHSKL